MLKSRLKIMRAIADITQQELSERTGISITTISGYENNKRIPNAETLWTLADALNCKVDDLYEPIKERD